MTFHLRDVIADLVPYEPGKPAEELMRERGLESVIKLASNEGPWGPLPQAAEVIAGGIDQLNALDPDTTQSSQGGLVRRSLDRAATVQAASTGSLSLLNQTGELKAAY